MAIDISKATIGYDEEGINTALNNIWARVIREAQDLMDKDHQKLVTAVDNCWKGESAEKFKKNMEADKNSVKTGLGQSYSVLADELQVIGAAISKIDKELIKERGN